MQGNFTWYSGDKTHELNMQLWPDGQLSNAGGEIIAAEPQP